MDEANCHCSVRQISCLNNYNNTTSDEFWTTMIFLFQQNFTSFRNHKKRRPIQAPWRTTLSFPFCNFHKRDFSLVFCFVHLFLLSQHPILKQHLYSNMVIKENVWVQAFVRWFILVLEHTQQYKAKPKPNHCWAKLLSLLTTTDFPVQSCLLCVMSATTYISLFQKKKKNCYFLCQTVNCYLIHLFFLFCFENTISIHQAAQFNIIKYRFSMCEYHL